MIAETSVATLKYIKKISRHFLIIIFISYLTPELNAQYSNPVNFVFVQVPQYTDSAENRTKKISSIFDRYVKNARIITYNRQSNTIKDLTPEFYAACDPDISFDGLNIIFSGKKSAQDYWQIWSMKTDGSEKRQLTSATGDCWMPVYAGNRFYLNDKQPTPQIVYAGNEHSWYNELESARTVALYGIDLEGKQKYRLTYNLYSDFSPDVLPDGRIVFSSWQPSGEGKLALMSVNVDGTDLMPYFGNHEMPRYKEMVHISDNDANVYYIESDQISWLGGGSIASISHRRPLHSYQKNADSGDKIFHSPCTLPAGDLIASCKSNSRNDEFSVYYIDQKTGNPKEKIYGQAGWHTIDTQIILPHPKVKGKSNWLIPGAESGVFYCLDSYRSDDIFANNLMPGQIKYVRVIEGMPQIKKIQVQIPPGTELKQKNSVTNPSRVLGTAPVESDGSFHVRVPAKTPINFQLLDKNHMKIREQKGWTWVMGNENRGCIGCHENRESSPPNVLVTAIPKPAVDLTEVPEKKHTLDFLNQIIPIFNKNCAKGCHAIDGSKSGFGLMVEQEKKLLPRDIYNNLLSGSDIETEKMWVQPGSASESGILDYIIAENMPDSPARQNHAEDLLTPEEILTIIEWIDLGAHYDLSAYQLSPNKH